MGLGLDFEEFGDSDYPEINNNSSNHQINPQPINMRSSGSQDSRFKLPKAGKDLENKPIKNDNDRPGTADIKKKKNKKKAEKPIKFDDDELDLEEI